VWGGKGEGGGGVGTASVVRVRVLRGDRASKESGGCGRAPLRVIRALHDDATMAHTGIRSNTHRMSRVLLLLLLQHRIL